MQFIFFRHHFLGLLFILLKFVFSLGASIKFENPEIEFELANPQPIPLNPPMGYFPGMHFLSFFFFFPSLRPSPFPVFSTASLRKLCPLFAK